MSVISRVGYAVAYVGFLILVTTIVDLFNGVADPVLWSISVVLLLIGIPLLMQAPYAKKLKWRLLWSSSPTGTIGVALTLYGTMVLFSVRRNLMQHIPIETWWQYLVMGTGALLLGIGMLVSRNPIKEPVGDAARNHG